jgi:hypothetical protein
MAEIKIAPPAARAVAEDGIEKDTQVPLAEKVKSAVASVVAEPPLKLSGVAVYRTKTRKL